PLDYHRISRPERFTAPRRTLNGRSQDHAQGPAKHKRNIHKGRQQVPAGQRKCSGQAENDHKVRDQYGRPTGSRNRNILRTLTSLFRTKLGALLTAKILPESTSEFDHLTSHEKNLRR